MLIINLLKQIPPPSVKNGQQHPTTSGCGYCPLHLKRSQVKKQQASIDSFSDTKKSRLCGQLSLVAVKFIIKKWAFIKVPIVYGTLATTITLTAFNQKQYKIFKQADYNLRNPVDPKKSTIRFFQIYPTIPVQQKLREIRDAYFKTTQQMYILTGVTYLLAAAEAFTSAHLAHFDVKDDLSLRLKPSFEPVTASGNAFGMGIQLKF